MTARWRRPVPGQGVFSISAEPTRKEETARARIGVHAPRHRAEHARRRLPFVEQDGLVEPLESHVRVSLEGRRLGRHVQADRRGRPALGRRRLSDRARADDDQRRELLGQLRENGLDQSRAIRGVGVGHCRLDNSDLVGTIIAVWSAR